MIVMASSMASKCCCCCCELSSCSTVNAAAALCDDDYETAAVSWPLLPARIVVTSLLMMLLDALIFLGWLPSSLQRRRRDDARFSLLLQSLPTVVSQKMDIKLCISVLSGCAQGQEETYQREDDVTNELVHRSNTLWTSHCSYTDTDN